MKSWKTSGPYGFPAGFYQRLWNVIGTKVCDFVCKVWEKPDEIVEVNQIDICLIPEVEQPHVVMYGFAISLCVIPFIRW